MLPWSKPLMFGVGFTPFGVRLTPSIFFANQILSLFGVNGVSKTDYAYTRVYARARVTETFYFTYSIYSKGKKWLSGAGFRWSKSYSNGYSKVNTYSKAVEYGFQPHQ